jgi:hypothetical protein
MAEKDLKANFDFATKNKEHLLKYYRDKFILVFDEEVIGSYDTYAKAAEEGVRSYGLEASFLVYHLVEEEPLNFVVEAML